MHIPRVWAKASADEKDPKGRLTPKPWRIDQQAPPGQHPREETAVRERFSKWLSEYEKTAAGFATCRYVETVGSGRATGDARHLQELHDRTTRCDEPLPLA